MKKLLRHVLLFTLIAQTLSPAALTYANEGAAAVPTTNQAATKEVLTIEWLSRKYNVPESSLLNELNKGYSMQDIHSALQTRTEPNQPLEEILKKINPDVDARFQKMDFAPKRPEQEKATMPQVPLLDVMAATYGNIPSVSNVSTITYGKFPSSVFESTYSNSRQKRSLFISDSLDSYSKTYDQLAMSRQDLKMNTAPFSVSSVHENVSLVSGSLQVQATDLVLPGRNGLSFALTRKYDSADSIYYDKDVYSGNPYTARYYPALNVRLYHKYTGMPVQYANASQFFFDPHYYKSILEYLGDMRAWFFPSIYPETWELDNRVREQHEKEWPYVNPDDPNSSPYMANYDVTLKGVPFIAKAYTTGYVLSDPMYQPSFSSQPRYVNKTKEKAYENRFAIGKGWSWDIPYIEYTNNKMIAHLFGGASYEIENSQLKGYPWKDITFAYDESVTVNNLKSTIVLKYLNGQKHYFSYDRLIQISDAYNNTIQFEYQYNSYGAVLSKVRDALGNEINITYSGTEVTLTLGDQTVKYEKQKDPKGNKELLSAVTDAENRKTQYSYEIALAPFDLVNDSRKKENYAALLKQVQHPTKARTQYEYISSDRKLGPIAKETVYRVKSREDIATYTDGSEEKYNYVSYDYHNEDGAEVQQRTYWFSTTINDGRKETTYNYKKEYIDDKTPEVIYNTVIKQVSGAKQFEDVMEYNEAKRWPSPIKVTSKIKVGEAEGTAKVVTKSYDDYGNVLTQTNPDNATITYTYHPTTHWLESVTQPVNAYLSRYTHYVRDDQKGSVLQVTDKDNNANGALRAQVNVGYDAFGNATTVTLKDDARNIVINKEYGPAYNQGFVTKLWSTVTDVDGAGSTIEQKAEYNKTTGKITRYIDGKNHATSYLYDKLGRVKEATFQDGSKVTMSYDDANNKITSVDQTGVTSFVQWNALGMKTSEGTVGSGTTSYGYDPYGRLSWSRDALSNATTYGYDAWNRSIRTTYPDGSASGVEYDDVNRTATTTDAEGNKTKETYDLLGRVTKKEWLKQTGTVPLSSNAYDFAGNVTSNVDGNNNTTSYAYDLFNRLVSVTNAKSETTKYSYNMAGKLIQMEYADGNKIQKQYDELGRLIRKIDALGQNERYYYDVNGNVKTYIDRKGQTTSYGYNVRDQLTSSVTGSETVSYEYDTAGRRTAMQDGTGRTQYGYNNVGQLDAVTYPDGKKVLYVYDPQGNRTQMTDPFGYVIAYGYDNRNRLKGVGPAMADWDASYDYKKNSLLSNVTQRNGIAWSYTFDGANLMNLSQTRYGAPVNSYGYTYDNNGNQTSKNENGQGNTFSYDKLDRIEKSSQFNEAYTYDTRGNRQTMQSSKSIDMSGAGYRYDDRNRLAQVTTDDGKNVSYRYNGDGMLYERTENGQTTRYYYDGANMIAEGTVSNGTVTMKARYIRGGSGLVARQDASGTKTFYLHNGHGDVVGLADGNGNVINRYTYDIWGNPLSTSEQVPQPFRYSGEFWDSSTNLQYLRARWYDPSVGRFINEDTYEGDIANPLSLNLYTYVLNNPLKYVDPTGHVEMEMGIGSSGRPRIVGDEHDSLLHVSFRMQISKLKSMWDYYNSIGDTSNRDKRHQQAVEIRSNPCNYGSTCDYDQTAEFVFDDNGILIGTAIIGASFTGGPRGTIDPNKVRFTQDSVKAEFSDGRSVYQLIDDLKSGNVKPKDIPEIRVFEKDGNLYSLDNRRLYAFQQANVNVRYRLATESEVSAQMWKMTTKNNGTSIRIRGGSGNGH
ncbi:RHS repeat domain-containing protein [Paenibacillus tyrfis]|uniref:RHS repeat domain-containing protein n=1 Tax=Paenibacillus tyrfis TaxID=1501230 RepID=UPI00209ED92F|nr:RHS repeat-associated core domain-containing protein [Paenibacillus tyrfis]MCP1307952.1 hypothetical protein [Paenibacillus tyrfis]